jgi:hypothetical protein
LAAAPLTCYGMEANMQPRYQDGIRATRAAFIVAASWVLLPALTALPLHRARAQVASQEQVDQRITSLLGQIETLVDEGHRGNAAALLPRALILSDSASPAGRRMMVDFPNALKKHAEAEHTAGHEDASARFEVFAEVASAVISLQQGPNAHFAMSGDVGPRIDTNHAVSSVSRQVAASAIRNPDNVAATIAPVIQLDARNPPSAASPPSSIAREALSENSVDTSPTAGPSSPLALAGARQSSPTNPTSSPETQPNAPRTSQASRSAEPAKIATLQPASPADIMSAHGHVKTNRPSPASPLSPSMIEVMLKQGEAMLSIGDISAARLLFIRAAESGNGKAAIEVGDTYNPIFLAERGVLGLQGDAESAQAWYRKALALGEPQARRHLVDLGGGAQTHAMDSLNER